MFVSDSLNSQMTVPKDVWSVIKKQAESLSARDRQIDELMGLLKEQIQENKKNHLPLKSASPFGLALLFTSLALFPI